MAVNDTTESWEELAEQKFEYMKNGDLKGVSYMMFRMALILYKEGRNHLFFLKESGKIYLMAIEKDRFYSIDKKVKIVTAREKSCPACKKLEGKIMTVPEAKKLDLLPVGECTHAINPKTKLGWCRCGYIETS